MYINMCVCAYTQDQAIVPSGLPLHSSEWKNHERKHISTDELFFGLGKLEMQMLYLISCWFSLYIQYDSVVTDI